MLCKSLSFTHICPICQDSFLTPKIYRRKLKQNIEVISFYKYSEIKDLLHTKHTDIGYHIYEILAQNSFLKFAKEFSYPYKVASVAIDDGIKSGYSHTAILNHSLKSDNIKPYFNVLRATNEVSYSGKTKEFRISNPREFIFKNFKVKDVILVDDIVTTGSTFIQALDIMKKYKKEVLFCLALVDVSNNF